MRCVILGWMRLWNVAKHSVSLALDWILCSAGKAGSKNTKCWIKSSAPIGMDSSGVFGIHKRVCFCFVSYSLNFSSKDFISSPRARISAWISVVSFPSFFKAPILFDSDFLNARLLSSSNWACLLCSSILKVH